MLNDCQVHPAQALAVDLARPQNRDRKGFVDGSALVDGAGVGAITKIRFDQQQSIADPIERRNDDNDHSGGAF